QGHRCRHAALARARAMNDAAVGETLPAAAQRVQDALEKLGHAGRVRVMPASTRTSAEAAAAVGCTVAEIAKSIIFRAKPSQRAGVVMGGGVNRVEEKKVAAVVGEGIGKADAEFVRSYPGFVIGGVPPVGHDTPPLVLIDEDLMKLTSLWAAAGTPHAVF